MTTPPPRRKTQGTKPPGPGTGAWRIVLPALEAQLAGASLDMGLSRALHKSGAANPAVRHAAVTELKDLNRHRARLTWHLGQVDSSAGASALVLAWLALKHRETPEFVRSFAELDAQEVLTMNALRGRKLNDPAMPEAARLECPPAFEAPLRAALGERFADEMRASLDDVPVDLRANLLKATRDQVAIALAEDGIECTSAEWSPWGLQAAPGAHVSATAAFRDGLVEFQDQGSQLVALLADARAGQQVLDYCAGAGGKTLALGAAMENRGHLVAADVHDDRLARAKERLKRAGVENAERQVLGEPGNKWAKRHVGRFDRVLVDAPCSGTGSWRRNPDARWSVAAAKLDELTALQDTVLEKAARFVKPGGRLTYATCSLLPMENDERIARFLARTPDFKAVDVRPIWERIVGEPWPCGEEQVLRLSPARHGTDGFFAAVLERSSQP